MSNRLRKKTTGEPTNNGGEFGSVTRGESGLTLDNWGSVNIGEGSRTPWGAAGHVDHPADGIAVVSCAGHGGVKLSPERNKFVPVPLRRSSGWYEEDCEAAIVGMYHPEAFDHYLDSDEDRVEKFSANVKDYFPDEYEQVTGETVTAEESYTRREQEKRATVAAFRAAHAEEFVSIGPNHDSMNAGWIPEGHRIFRAKADSTGEERQFLVPADQAGVDQVVINDSHLDVTDIASLSADNYPYEGIKVDTIYGEGNLGYDTSGLTSSATAVAEKELNQPYMFTDRDGTQHIESITQHLGRVGATGKNAAVHSASGYRVSLGDGTILEIKKASYDALTKVPDTSTENDRAVRESLMSEAALKRARGTYDPKKIAKARERHETAKQNHRDIMDRNRAQSEAWRDKTMQMRKAAFDRLTATD